MTQEFKHAPAPWYRNRWGDLKDAHGNDVCFHGIATAHKNVKYVKDNTKLVDNAPELLEACKMQLALIDDMVRFVGKMALKDYKLLNDAPMKARAVIAKTEGGAS